MLELLLEFLRSETLSAPSFGHYWKKPIGRSLSSNPSKVPWRCYQTILNNNHIKDCKKLRTLSKLMNLPESLRVSRHRRRTFQYIAEQANQRPVCYKLGYVESGWFKETSMPRRSPVLDGLPTSTWRLFHFYCVKGRCHWFRLSFYLLLLFWPRKQMQTIR